MDKSPAGTLLTYAFNVADLAAYQHVVGARMRANLSPKHIDYVAAVIAITLTAGLFLVLSDRLSARVFGYAPYLPTVIAGFVVGILTMLALQWATYLKQIRVLARPGGPTLAQHTLQLVDDGVDIQSPLVSARYFWPVITGVSVEKTIVILWVEPALGIAIPRRAFASPEQEAAFVATVRSKLST